MQLSAPFPPKAREPEKALREAQQQVQRTGQALRWARGQVRGAWQSLLLLLLKYYLGLFAAIFGHDLWDAYTDSVLAARGFGVMAWDAAESAILAGTIFGLLEWWRGRRMYAEVLGQELSKAETEKRS